MSSSTPSSSGDSITCDCSKKSGCSKTNHCRCLKYQMVCKKNKCKCGPKCKNRADAKPDKRTKSPRPTKKAKSVTATPVGDEEDEEKEETQPDNDEGTPSDAESLETPKRQDTKAKEPTLKAKKRKLGKGKILDGDNPEHGTDSGLQKLKEEGKRKAWVATPTFLTELLDMGLQSWFVQSLKEVSQQRLFTILAAAKGDEERFAKYLRKHLPSESSEEDVRLEVGLLMAVMTEMGEPQSSVALSSSSPAPPASSSGEPRKHASPRTVETRIQEMAKVFDRQAQIKLAEGREASAASLCRDLGLSVDRFRKDKVQLKNDYDALVKKHGFEFKDTKKRKRDDPEEDGAK